MKTKIVIFAFALFLFSGCENKSDSETNRTNSKPQNTASAAPPPTVSNTPANTVGGSSSIDPKAKYFEGTGKVTKINLEIGSVELDHEEIKGLMPKMIMEFYVSDPAQLKVLKIGDKVNFTLEDKGGAERITNIVKK